MEKLEIPCSYQGGKQRLAKQIVDIILSENTISDNTIFYDLCCGSGAISLEMINSGFDPNNIVMIDNGCFGDFWRDIANGEFDLDAFRKELDYLTSVDMIQEYLLNLSKKTVNYDMMSYHYLMLQAGSFGSKQIWTKGDKWVTQGFRSYWLPTETSNRKSPVNPMMPMPETLFNRVKNIVDQISGCIVANRETIYESLIRIKENIRDDKKVIIYIDPPYMNTTGYKETFDIYDFISEIPNDIPVYISEGVQLRGARETYLLSKGRSKGNISGGVKKKPVEEWLNRFV